MASVDFSLNTICQQRSRQLLYNPPPIRFNLFSPYPKYTQTQLDMRRKAEILKYNNNTSNTKTNNLTKAQRWGQIVSGNYQNHSFTQMVNFTPDNTGGYQLNINKITTVSCPNDGLIPTPTSSSNIPGPLTYLIRDESIPLYNYVTNTNTLGTINQENTGPWQIIISNDIYFSDGNESLLFTLYLQPTIEKKAYVFDFQLPMGIYITGTDIAASQIGIPINYSNMINISNISLSVYYNNEKVKLKNNPTLSFINTPVSYNISFIPRSTNDSFTMCAYYGILNVSNLVLYAEPGFIFDIKAVFSVNDNGNTYKTYSTTIKNTTRRVYANLSESNIKITKNCNIVSNSFSIPRPYPAFSFTDN